MSYGPPNDPQGGQQPPPGYQQPPQAPQVPPPGYQQPPQGYQPPPTAYGQGSQMPSAQNIAAGFQGFSLGRKLVLGGGLVTLIMFFLPWYSFSLDIDDAELAPFVQDSSQSVTGLGGGGLPLLGFLLLLVLLVAMALPLFGRRLRDLVPIKLTDGQIGLYGAAGVLALSVLGAFITKPSSETSLLTGIDASWSFGIGFWLALLAMLAMTAGGWLMFQAKE
jgi:hypothetical protein